MKNIVFLLFLMIFISLPAAGKNSGKFDINSGGFMDLDRYIGTFEINENAFNEDSDNGGEDDSFEPESDIDIEKRYEANAVELNLDDYAEKALESVNGSRIFNLKINETQYNIEQAIKTENMIWDGSKLFSQSVLLDSRYMAPIPSIINSSKITYSISPALSASMGQSNLYDANGHSVLFVRANESTYNTGAVISYKGGGLNLAAGSFSSSYNHASSGGAVLSSGPVKLPHDSGSLVLGAAYFTNEAQENNKTTGGGFIEYTYKRLKLNAQLGQSKYSDLSAFDTSLYFIPEFVLSNSLSLKTRIIRNITQDTMQDELVLTYKPKSSKNNFIFEINASNQYTPNSVIKQRIKFSTSFRI